MAFLEFKGESLLDLSLSLSCGNRNPYELFCNPIADTLCCNSEYVSAEEEGVDTREKDFLRCIETQTDSEILLHPCNSPTFVDCSLSIGIPGSSASLPSEGMLKKNKRNGNCRRGNVTKLRKTPNSNKNNQWRKSCRKSSVTFPTPTALRLMSVTVKECSKCLTTTTPLWRKGPNGNKSLCNACGIRYGKEVRKALSTAAVLFKDSNPPN